MKRRVKKFFRILAWSAGILVSLLLIFYLALKIVFPEAKLKQLIAGQVQAATGWQLSFETIHWNLSGFLEIEELNLQTSDEEKARRIFHLDKARLRFRIGPLLQKRLEISAISFDSPQLNLSLKDLAKFSQPASSSIPADTSSSPQSGSEAQPLPLGIDLHSLALNHFDLTLDFSDSLVSQSAAISDLNLEVNDLAVPRGFPNASQFVSGGFRFFTGKSQARYQRNGERFEISPEIDLTFHSNKSGAWEFDPKIQFTDAASAHRVILSGSLQGVRFAESLQVSDLIFQMDDQRLIRIDGSAAVTERDTVFQINLLGDRVDLASLLLTARAFIPSAYDSLFDGFQLSGRSQPLRGFVRGTPDTIAFDLTSSIDPLNLSMIPVDVRNVRAKARVTGSWTQQGLADGALSLNFQNDTLMMAINDSTEMTIRDIISEATLSLDSKGFPVRGDFTAHISHLFSGALHLDGNWSMPAADRWSETKASAALSLDGLALSELPGQTDRLWGDFNAGAHIQANSVRDLRYQISGAGNDVAFLSGEVKEELPVTTFENTGALSFDPENRILTIDSTQFHLLDVISGQSSGKIDLAKQSGAVFVESIRLNNTDIARVVPKRLAPQFEWIKLHGEEAFSGKLTYKTEQGIFLPEFSGEMRMTQAGAELLEQDLSLSGLESTIRFHGNPDKIDGDVAVSLDSLSAPFRPEPVTGTSLHLDWHLFGPDSLTVENGRLGIPSLALQSGFDFHMNLLQPVPRFKSDILVEFNPTDWLALNEMIACRGNSRIDLSVSSLNTGEQRIGIRGHMRMDSLSVKQEELLSVSNIHANIPLDVEFDLSHAELVPYRKWTTRYRPSYESVRSFYQAKDGTVDNLKIDRIQIMEYALDHITMDVLVNHGILDVPYFSMDVLDGRVGGSLWFNPGTGNPDSLAYRLRAHMTRINSAALMSASQKKDEETELNANLDFTGRGVDPKRGIDLDGFFHITQIGPGFASTLLKGLDPEGKDAGMKMTRRLMDLGYKPKVFSFELRHGYVYPSLSLSQPWYLPIRVPGRLEYTRLPVEFFMTNKIVQNQ